MQKYVEFLREFQKWNPDVVNQMRNCSHHFNVDNLNPYHLEGDVWSHTMMMYRDYLNLLNDDLKNNRIAEQLAIAILCHDIGKIYNRMVPKGQYGKIANHGHSYSSVQPATDFMTHLRKKGLFDYDMYPVLNVISNHMNYFDKNIDPNLLSNGNINIFNLGYLLHHIDIRNGFNQSMDFLNYFRIEYVVKNRLHDIEINYNYTEPDIYIFCGCPGSGKDYVAENIYKCKVFSYDDIRVDLYKEKFDTADKSEAEIYDIAWKWCNSAGVDLNKHLKKQIEANLKEDPKCRIAISNTNLTGQARLKLAHLFKDYTLEYVYVYADSKTMMKRNKSRSSKNLDDMVMNRFMYSQQVPSLADLKNLYSRSAVISSYDNSGE